LVFQSGQLVPELSAIGNIALPLLLGRRTAARTTTGHTLGRTGSVGPA
jgi:predicted ABC-type transport system involved in lysophospholipase L1 biosynthesis ATPase subunit